MASPELPRTFKNFSHYLRLTDQQQACLWRALTRATWSDACGLRQSFLLRDVVAFEGQSTGQASPANVVRVLEALVTERLLTRRQATGLEEAILSCVRDGRWMNRNATL